MKPMHIQAPIHLKNLHEHKTKKWFYLLVKGDNMQLNILLQCYDKYDLQSI